MVIENCPQCRGKNLYQSKSPISDAGPLLLPGLGANLFSSPTFDVVVCQDCGLTRLFATSEAREKLSISKKWVRTS
jgi:hypothetical protein